LEGYFESKGLTGFSEKIPIDSKGLTANLPSRDYWLLRRVQSV
jgi:hypothetical protein